MSIEKYFDKNWENTILSSEKKEQIEVILSFILKYSNNEKLNYFEFGCGNCYVTNSLFKNLKNRYKDISFHVSDISKIGLNLCDNNFKKTVVNQEKMAFTNLYNSMDIVASFEVFEHLTDELEQFYLNELLEISKKYLLIGVPYKEKLEKREVLCSDCNYSGHIYGHLRSYDINKFSNLFGDRAELLEYQLCGATETDFKTTHYTLAKKLGFKILNFSCPSCVKDINYISFVNRVRNKAIMSFLFNKKIAHYTEHPFWIVGIFEKVDNNNEKK